MRDSGCNEQPSLVHRVLCEDGVYKALCVIEADFCFRELSQIGRGGVTLSVRDSYIGVGNFELEVLVAVNVAAQRSQILQRIGDHLHSDLRRSGQTSDVIVEFDKFISQLTDLRETLFGNLSFAIRNIESGGKAADHKHNSGGAQRHHRAVAAKEFGGVIARVCRVVR